MLYLKGCPRCHGDLYLDRDSHGAFRQCLQCGFIQDLRDVPPAGALRMPRPAVAGAVTRAAPGKVAVA